MRAALQKTARDVAYQAAKALEHRTLETKFKGIGGIQNQVNKLQLLPPVAFVIFNLIFHPQLQKLCCTLNIIIPLIQTFQIHNIVIIQPTAGNLVMPTSSFCTSPALPLHAVVKQPETPTLLPKESSQPEILKNVSSSQTKTSESKHSAQTVASDTQAIKSTSEDQGRSNPGTSLEGVRVENASTCDEAVVSHTEKDKASEDLFVSQAQNKDKILEERSKTQSECLISENKDAELPAFECGWDGSGDSGGKETEPGSSRVGEGGESITHREDYAVTDDESQLQKNTEQVNDTKSAINAQPDSMSKADAVNSKFVCESLNIPGMEKNESGTENISQPQTLSASPVSLCESSPPCTPEKLSPVTPPFPSQHLYLCTPFTTPQKLGDQTISPTSHSSSPLCTPILPAPSPASSTDEALQGLRQRNLTAELETSEELHRTSSSLVMNVPYGQGQNIDEVTGKGKPTTPLRRVTESPIIDRRSALVTSVYEVPVLMKEKEKRSLRLINITPSKPETRLRKISPAKTFRSPIKTSPLKQVSPILRKYHKYSPKKRHIRSGKLLPILPKITVSKS